MVGRAFSFFILILVTWNCFAFDSTSQLLKNTKEHTSNYFKKEKNLKSLRKFQKRISKKEREFHYKSILNTIDQKTTSVCEEHVFAEIEKYFSKSDLKSVLYDLRELNYLDDIGLESLLYFQNLKYFKIEKILSTTSEFLNFYDQFNSSEFSFYQSAKSSQCLLSTWVMLKNNIQKLLESKDITINSKNIHLLNKAALINGYIHYPEYILIEKLNFLEKQNYPLPIKNYLEKKRILLSRKFGLETKSSGQSKFAQQKRKNKSKLTRRNYLYQNYSGTQIINMASIFERLQYYLTADAGKVILYKEGEEIFVRDLSSMEIYCTAINTFRLSMEELKLNTFIGAPMQYTDIVMAGYELNVISAEELEEVLKIEDIWNPKKTIFQKIMNWVEPLGMVGSVLLVPPYNVVFGVVFSLARSVSNLKRGEGEKLHNIINCN